MNIFAVHENPETAARQLCDTHVHKMCLESAQILTAALRRRGIEKYAFYDTKHKNHPCHKWAAKSWDNWVWLARHFKVLNEEFCQRYDNTIHGSYEKAVECWMDDGSLAVPPFESLGRTDFTQVMLDEFKQDDAVEAYRDYYAFEKFEKDWFDYSVERPDWLLERRKAKA